MNVETFLLADSAQDYQGKLCVLGAFDTIWAGQVPAQHPHSALVVRIRFEKSEEGQHQFRIMMIDADGHPIGPKIEGGMEVRVPPELDSFAQNLIMGFNGLPLPRFGTYRFDFVIDGHQIASAPLRVVQIQQVKKAA